MDTKTLCLGVLSLCESSGYGIKKLFEEAFVHFYPASFGSIYPALAQLERDGLIEGRTVAQDGRPDKRVFRITPQGEAHLEAALAVEPPRHKVRSEFLALMFFSHLLQPQRLVEVLDERRAEIAAIERHLQQVLASDDLPAGARFCAGYGQALLVAAGRYMDENRGWLEAELAGERKEQERLT